MYIVLLVVPIRFAALIHYINLNIKFTFYIDKIYVVRYFYSESAVLLLLLLFHNIFTLFKN